MKTETNCTFRLNILTVAFVCVPLRDYLGAKSLKVHILVVLLGLFVCTCEGALGRALFIPAQVPPSTYN